MLDKVVKNKIENVYGHKIRYPRDCDGLAADIFSKSGYRLSSSTIKRLFGFITTTSKPNQYTLDSIAIYLGYESWLQFSNSNTLELEKQESNLLITKQKKKRFISLKIIFWVLGLLFLGGLIVAGKLINNYSTARTLKYSFLKNLPEPRTGGKTVVLGNSIYYIGGDNFGLMNNNNWQYNSSTNSWKILAPMPTKRTEIATALLNCKIYCFGGWQGNSIGMSDIVEVYDIKKNKWDSLPNLPTKITSANAVSFGNDIYILGGTTGETYMYFFKYNTVSKNYESLPLFNVNVLHSCMLIANNKIYVLGGQSYRNFKYHWENIVYSFDITKKEWLKKAPIPILVSGATAVELNNKIHLLGGKDAYGNNNLNLKNNHFVYDIKNNTWVIAEKLPYPVCGHQIQRINRKFILMGGLYKYPNPTDRVITF